MAEVEQGELLGPTVGERIRAAREKKGLSLDDVAAQTRIPIRHLQHIEQGEWESLPAITYSIGFTRAYANAVGLDGPAIATELREELGPNSRTPTTAPPVYYEPADAARVPPRSLVAVVAVLALVLAAGYLIWRNSAVEDPISDESQIVAAPEAKSGAPAPPPANVPAVSAAAATGPVVLTATSEVWLRIYEGNGGRRIHEGILKPGESYQVPATAQAPQILTGRPNALRVAVGSAVIPQLEPVERTVSDVSLRPADLIARAQDGGPAPAAPGFSPAPAD